MWRTHAAFIMPSVAASTAGAGAVDASLRIADPNLMLVCAIGIPIGILAMIGIGVSRQKPPVEIKRDVTVAMFLALANFAISVILAARLGLPYLESLGLAIAASATNSLLAEKFIAKWTRDIPKTEAEKRQEAQNALSAAHIAYRAVEKERERKTREVRDDDAS